MPLEKEDGSRERGSLSHSVQKGPHFFTIIAPTVPQDVISTSKSSSHLLVRWKPPVQRNGNITYYLVLWQRLAEDGDLYINDYCHRGALGVPQTGYAQWQVDRYPDFSLLHGDHRSTAAHQQPRRALRPRRPGAGG